MIKKANNTGRLYCIVLAVIIIVFSASCDLFAPKGNIEVTIIQKLDDGRGLAPPIDITPASYTITGTGPSGATFTQSVASTKTTISNLQSSTWTITVHAFNAEGKEIAAGTATADLTAGATVPVAVTVVPLSGNGILNITLEWPSGVVTNPAVTASLTPLGGGSAIPPSSSSVGATTASLSWSSVAAGGYALAIQLKDGDTFLAGKADSVMILKDQIVSGSYVWTDDDKLGGGISVTITPQMEIPLAVSINGSPSSYLTLNEGETMALTASVDGNPAGVSYAWYVNGVNQNNTANNLTVDSTWPAREYQIDVIATAPALGRAGSASICLTLLSSQAVAEWARTVSSGRSTSRFAGAAVDGTGNIYAAGYQQGTDRYAYGSDVSAKGASASSNSVLVKYDASGTAQWARTVSAGSGSSQFSSVAVDAAGNVYAAGWQEGTGIYTYGSGVSIAGTSVFNNIVLVKYASDGTAQWARTVSAGSGSSQFSSVAVDAAGNVYAAGWQEGTGIYTYGNGVSIAGTSASSNVVLVKYNASGTAQWARTVSAGSGSSLFSSAAVDVAGNIYAAGWQEGTGTYTYGSGVSIAGTGASSNVVLVKYTASGKAQWARTVSTGSGSSQFSSAAVDAAGNIYAAGWQEGNGSYAYASAVSIAGTSASSNIMLVKYDASGTAQWARTVSAGTSDSVFNSVAVGSGGNIYAAGYQYGAGNYAYGTAAGASGTSTSGNAVLVKYNASGAAQWARTVASGTRYSQFGALVVDGLGSIYAAGSQQGTGAYSYESAVSAAGSSTSHNSVLVKYRE